MSLDLRELALRLGGDVYGQNALVPGPGHSLADRSLSIRIEPAAPNGFICHSFAGDPPALCRDHVRAALGPAAHSNKPRKPPSLSESLQDKTDRDADRRISFALKLWKEARDPRGTVVTTYLAARGLVVPDEVANEVIRFHPKLATTGGAVGGMLALFRDIHSDEPCGIHRTFLDPTGGKLGRMMLGRARAAAIKLDANAHVTLGLHIAEGIESALAAWLAGFRPVWAVGSVTAVSAFPLLAGIETITILGEVDDGGASCRAAQACGTRWTDAGREVLVVRPRVGDLNDVWQEATR